MSGDRRFLDAPHRRFIGAEELHTTLANDETVRVDPFALWSIWTPDGDEPVDCAEAAAELIADGVAEVVSTLEGRFLVLTGSAR